VPLILAAALAAWPAAAAPAALPLQAHPELPLRTTTYVIDPRQSTGELENFREVWVNPSGAGAALRPLPGGGATGTDLPLRNTSASYADVTVAGVALGRVNPLTSAVVRGVSPGVYEVTWKLQNGFVETQRVATREVQGPLTPGSVAGTRYTTELPPTWHADPQRGYTPPPPPPAPKPRKRVRMAAQRIEFDDKVLFALGSADIDAQSHALLDEMAGVILGHPDVRKVEVQGHTDSQGDPAANRALSQSRAQAVVDYLVGKGIEAERLVARGLGPDQPLVEGDQDEAHAANRRVELHVLQRDPPPPAPADAPAADGPATDGPR